MFILTTKLKIKFSQLVKKFQKHPRLHLNKKILDLMYIDDTNVKIWLFHKGNHKQGQLQVNVTTSQLVAFVVIITYSHL